MPGYGLSIRHIEKNMNVPIFYTDLPDDCLGRVYLSESDIKIFYYDIKDNQIKYADHHAKPGTLLINENLYYYETNANFTITIAHELIHWQFHQRLFKILNLLETDSGVMNCMVQPISFDESMTDIEKAICIAEWQANALSIRLAMPKDTVDFAMTINAFISPWGHYENLGDKMQDSFIKLAHHYNVPYYVAKERLRACLERVHIKIASKIIASITTARKIASSLS